MSDLDFNAEASRGRQRRLLGEMHRLKLDLVIVQSIEHVQYLTGARFGWVFSPLAALRADGHLTLVAPKKPLLESAADEVVSYEAQWHSTLRNDQREASSAELLRALAGKTSGLKRIGVEFSCFTSYLATLPGERVDIEPTLYRLRRRKDSDELARIKKAIAGTGKMYALARQIIEPGITEIEVFNRLQSAAVEEFGEMIVPATGNDYACGARGGPPRNGHKAEAGELYILDLGPAYRGYFADNSRAFAVNRRPTDVQQEAFAHIMRAFGHIEASVKPGKKCQELFQEVQAILDEAPVGVFNHHLGHGIGLFPHEGPHLNPFWDDTFEVGDVFTCEPGLYDEQLLRAGMRLENDYVVTPTGIENLSPFPMEL
jgi:Xaa-Pro aminopeptidase